MTRFKTVGVIGRYRTPHILETVKKLVSWLLQSDYTVVLEQGTATQLDNPQLAVYSQEDLGGHCKLIIVVGGDGSLLWAARTAANHNTPLLGINHGRLGFLTDIHPTDLEAEITQVLNGQYIEEKRFLLTATLNHDNKLLAEQDALNEIILMPGELPHMIEFEIYIDNNFVCYQRADGLIVATPTGSTAYALSGGGPILHPELDAMVLVPMFPHTLSTRPIVVKGDSDIKIIIATHNESAVKVSCDGRQHLMLPPEGTLHIKKKSKQLRLIHPTHYNYYETLRSKLGWERNP